MLSRMIAYRRRDVFAQDITTERQGQTGLALPPFSQIEDLGESRSAVGELALVNDQARRGCPAFHRLEDLIEWDNDVIESAEIELQREVCARHPARDCDRPISKPGADFFVRRIGAKAFRAGRDHHWAIAIAHAGAAGQKRVPVAHIRKCVNRDRGDVQLAAKRAFIQRLNIFEPVFEAIRNMVIDLLPPTQTHREAPSGSENAAQAKTI